MRLGEIKQKLDQVTGENHLIEIKHEPQFGGQAQEVSGFINLNEVLQILSQYVWSEIDPQSLEDDFEATPKTDVVTLTQEVFTRYNTYVTSVNTKLPIFYSVIESIVDEQDEQTINIKLPKKIKSITDLSSANTRLSKILTLYNVDGDFEFRGFDKGSEWYVITAIGTVSHLFLTSGLSIAKKYFDTKQSYYKSETAKQHYKAATEKDTVTDEELEEYCARRMKGLIKSEVETALQEIGHGTWDKNELQVQIIKATTLLIAELEDEGTEFHLSLNPPDYASEGQSGLVIDYKKIPKQSLEKMQLSSGDTKKKK
jgi:hypothetical protein